MPSVFGKKGTFSKRHLTSLAKMAVFTKFFFLLLQHFQPHRHAYHVSKAVDGSFRILLQQLIRQEQFHGEGVGLPFYFINAEKGMGFEEWRRYAFM